MYHRRCSHDSVLVITSREVILPPFAFTSTNFSRVHILLHALSSLEQSWERIVARIRVENNVDSKCVCTHNERKWQNHGHNRGPYATYIRAYMHTYNHTYIHTYIHTGCIPPDGSPEIIIHTFHISLVVLYYTLAAHVGLLISPMHCRYC